MLKVNQEKTELIVISSKFGPRPAIPYVSVGDEQILSCELINVDLPP